MRWKDFSEIVHCVVLKSSHQKPNEKRPKKKRYGIHALVLRPKIVIEDRKLSWIKGDVTKFEFDDELVDVNESNKRLIIIFLVMSLILLIISTVLTIQYCFMR